MTLNAMYRHRSPFSTVRFGGPESRNMGRITDSGEIKAGILCSADVLAESKTFEPSAQVVSVQVINVCVGYRG